MNEFTFQRQFCLRSKAEKGYNRGEGRAGKGNSVWLYVDQVTCHLCHSFVLDRKSTLVLRITNPETNRRMDNITVKKFCLQIFPATGWGIIISYKSHKWQGFPGGSMVKKSAFNAADASLIPGWDRFPGEGNGNPLQNSCLENSMDRGTLWATVHGVQRVGRD